MNNITPKDAQKLIEQGALVVDVRTPAEFNEGHIPLAQNISIGDVAFEEKINALDKNATYVINCQSGGRSSRATAFMREMGFKNAFNLEGGIMGWMREGMTIEKE